MSEAGRILINFAKGAGMSTDNKHRTEGIDVLVQCEGCDLGCFC